MAEDTTEPVETDPIDQYTQQMRVVSRRGTSEYDSLEAAAAIAVLREVLIAEAEARHEANEAGDAWARSTRSLRGTLTPGAGQWRSFS